MSSKAYDRFLLIATLIILSPLLAVAVLTIAIGYPLHVVRRWIT
jgi:hypothetical protein